MRSILDDLSTRGVETMSRFNAGAAQQIWYYTSVVSIMSKRLGQNNSLAAELSDAVSEFEEAIGTAG